MAYQIPEYGKSACGRSFEDAFILANRDLFGIKETGDENEIEFQAYKQAKKFEKKKTDFAMKYSFEFEDWSVPNYLEEGLIWLDTSSEVVKVNYKKAECNV